MSLFTLDWKTLKRFFGTFLILCRILCLCLISFLLHLDRKVKLWEAIIGVGNRVLCKCDGSKGIAWCIILDLKAKIAVRYPDSDDVLFYLDCVLYIHQFNVLRILENYEFRNWNWFLKCATIFELSNVHDLCLYMYARIFYVVFLQHMYLTKR